MPSTLRIGAIAGVVAVVLSCGDDGVEPEAGESEAGAELEPVATFEEYCSREAELYCSMLETCCLAAGAPFQRSVCERTIFGLVIVGWCGVAEQPAKFDPDAAARCLSLRAQLYPDCGFRRLDDPLTIEAAQVCERVAEFTPHPPGEPCTHAFCFSAPRTVSRCDFPSHGAPSQCSTPTPRPLLGESCGGGWLTCDFGLYCSLESCAEPLADGESCTQDYECGSNECTDPEPNAPIGRRVCEPVRRVGWMECDVFRPRVLP